VKQLSVREGAPASLRALRFVEMRLLGVPSLRHHAIVVAGWRAELKAAYEAWEEARDFRQVAAAAVRYADTVQDRAVSRLSEVALTEVDGDREAPAYRRIFHQNASEIIKPVATDAQQSEVARVLAASADAPALAAKREQLKLAYEALNDAISTRLEAGRNEAKSRMDLDLLLEEIAQRYRRFAASLLAEGVDPTLADSCFPGAETRRRGAKAEDDGDGEEG
jgi:hypothetical protein